MRGATVANLLPLLGGLWPKFVCLQLRRALDVLERSKASDLPAEELLFVAECLVSKTMSQLDSVLAARLFPSTAILAPSSVVPLMPAPLRESRPATPASSASSGKQLCIDFANGKCRRGADCVFSHEKGKN